MGTINKVILIGNLGKDPEVFTTQSGTKIVSFSLATSERFKKRNGEVEEKTQWHRVKLFGKIAEIGEQYLKKGNSVYIEGRIEYSQYEEKYYTDIIATNVTLMGGKSQGPKKEAEGDPNSKGEMTDEIMEESDDLPF